MVAALCMLGFIALGALVYWRAQVRASWSRPEKPTLKPGESPVDRWLKGDH